MKRAITLIALLATTACAPKLPASGMFPMTHVYQEIPSNEKLERSIEIGAVTVPKDVESSTVAPFTAVEYKEALANALLTSNFLVRAGGTPKYKIEANMTSVDIPMFGFTMDSTATASYKLIDIKTSDVVMQETITQKAEGDLSDAFDANERARLVTGYAVRENITHLLRVLSNVHLSKKGK